MPENYLPPNLMREGLRELEVEFYQQYGATLANWARLEQALSRLFQALCGFETDDPLGPALFFSGRSFNTRYSLLSAASRNAHLPEEVQEVLRALLKRARQFETARNKIAHGFPVHLIQPGVVWQGWRIKEGEEAMRPGGIGIEELRAAASNFHLLELAAERVRSLVRSWQAGLDVWPEEYLTPIRSLPNDALLPSEGQTAEESPPPSEGKKG